MSRVRTALLALSASGLLAIAGYEGYSATAYKDSGGIYTVGFGHTGSEVSASTRVTVVQALKVLGRDVGKTEKALQSCLGDDVLLTQYEWDAYVSLAYNVGASAVCKSSIKRKLKAGQYAEACRTILDFDKVRVGGKLVQSKGLANRRKAEYQICIGNYQKQSVNN